jgi:Co/Zn/Cd efflux system component
VIVVIFKIFKKSIEISKLKLKALAQSVKETIESKELQFNIHKDIGSNHLKKLHFELNGKKTNEKLSLTIKNSENKEKTEVKRAFELVHSYPINDDFKIKVR